MARETVSPTMAKISEHTVERKERVRFNSPGSSHRGHVQASNMNMVTRRATTHLRRGWSAEKIKHIRMITDSVQRNRNPAPAWGPSGPLSQQSCSGLGYPRGSELAGRHFEELQRAVKVRRQNDLLLSGQGHSRGIGAKLKDLA